MLGTHWLLLAAALIAPSQAIPRSRVSAGYVVHEKRDVKSDHESRWVKRDRVNSAAILPVRIGLTQNNLNKGHDLLMELSHPESPEFGQWWSIEDVHDFFAPSAESVDLVRTWIKSAGIADHRIVHHDNKGWLAVDATAAEAEMLFATTFHEYEHTHLGEISVGTDIYHVPQHLAAHIDIVTPGLKLVRVKKRTTMGKAHPMKPDAIKRDAGSVLTKVHTTKHRPLLQEVQHLIEEVASEVGNLVESLPINITGLLPPSPGPQLDPSLQGCWYNNTITCFRALYGIPESPQAVEGNELGIFSTGDYFSKAAMDKYYTMYASWVPNGTQPIPALINGGQYNAPENSSSIYFEIQQDIQYSQAIIYPQNVTLYQVDDPIYADKAVHASHDDGYLGFDNFFNAIDGSFCTYSAFGQTGNDQKVDPSYPNPNPAGYQGQLMCGVYKPTKVISVSFGNGEQDLPANYQRRVCNEVLKLSLAGTTVLSATGDYGVAGFPNDPAPNGCLGPEHTIFNPFNLITCPYVLAVGGTQINDNQTILDPEHVMHYPFNNYTCSSSGGFSNLFPRLDYQQEAVQYYLDNYAPSYPYYSELDPDFNTVQGLYNRLGRAFPDVSINAVSYIFPFLGDIYGGSGTSLASPFFASILTLINQERALIGKSSVGFVHPVFYAHPEVFTDITNGTNPGCGTDGFPAAPGWDAATGLGTPRYAALRDLYLLLP